MHVRRRCSTRTRKTAECGSLEKARRQCRRGCHACRGVALSGIGEVDVHFRCRLGAVLEGLMDKGEPTSEEMVGEWKARKGSPYLPAFERRQSFCHALSMMIEAESHG